ncbi:MAG: hypothetical protein LBU65_05060 [Planctomycetaceae bacterium]|jgi:beta-lactamase regulating signal transducer with metallopeptidase domain|nr:hypothetical protein [Planctomycetaceae bacterium]
MDTLFTLFLSVLLAGTVLPLLAIIASCLMRKTSASARHRMLTLTAVGLLVFPFTVLTRDVQRDESNAAAVTQLTVTQDEFLHDTIQAEPSTIMVDIDTNFVPVTDTATVANITNVDVAMPLNNVTNTTATNTAASFDVVDTSKNAVVCIWLAGVGVLLVNYLSVHLRMLLFIRRKTSLANVAFGTAVDEIRQRFHLRRPVRCELTEAIPMPVTVGIFRSRILFPIEAKDWSDEKIRAVLLHELAHIVRRDIVWQNVVQLASIVYWFQPLVWLIVKRIKIEQEFACDDMVLESGQRNSDYASVLLDLSKSISVNFSNKQIPEGGLTMLRKKTVIKRIDAILDTETVRRPIGRKMSLAILAATLCLVGIVSTFSPKVTLPVFAQAIPLATTNPNATVEAVPPMNDEENQPAEKPILLQDKPQDADLSLLQKRVEVAKIKLDEAEADYKNGTGSAENQAKAQITLADAEIELYRLTGDQTKLTEAVKVKIDAAGNLVILRNSLFEHGKIRRSELADAELTLAYATDELKKLGQPTGKTELPQNNDLNLLQKRVEAAKIKYDETEADSKNGTGSAESQAKARIALSDAEIPLYRFIGDKTKLIRAAKYKVDAAGYLVRGSRNAFEAGKTRYSDVANAELILADASKELIALEQRPLGVTLPQDDDLNLLQKRVEAAKIKLDEATLDYNGGGSAENHAKAKAKVADAQIVWAEAQIALSDVEIALFRRTGDVTRLVESLEAKSRAAQILAEGKKISIDEALQIRNEVEDELTRLVGHRDPKKPLLFQGKTFEQWVSELKTELDPKMRSEAFRALAAFGANGHGKEAIAVIFDVAKSYDFSIIDNDVFGEMKQSAIDAFSNTDVRVPLKDSIPILLQKFSNGDNNEKRIAIKIFYNIRHYQETRESLPKIIEVLTQLDIEKVDVVYPRDLFFVVTEISGSDKYVLQFLKEAIAKNDARRFGWMFVRFEREEISYREGAGRTISRDNVYYGTTSKILHNSIKPNVVVDYFEMDQNGRRVNKSHITPFGESLLKLLQESGVSSSDETIRETSKKVVEALLAIEKVENERETNRR